MAALVVEWLQLVILVWLVVEVRLLRRAWWADDEDDEAPPPPPVDKFKTL